MPWAIARLRGQKVFARVDGGGAYVASGGRVEIRYKLGDTRAYNAGTRNLERDEAEALLPDDAFGPGVAPAEKGDAGEAAKSSPARARVDRKAPEASPSQGRVAGGWLAYTDGACSGNPGPAGAGMVIIHPGGKVEEGYEFLGTATNNVAELTAILRALEAVPAAAPGILVHTDSQYAIGVLTKGWKAKANQELVATTKALLAKRPQARLSYVPGHAGVPMNERADELAREAIRTRRTTGLPKPA